MIASLISIILIVIVILYGLCSAKEFEDKLKGKK